MLLFYNMSKFSFSNINIDTCGRVNNYKTSVFFQGYQLWCLNTKFGDFVFLLTRLVVFPVFFFVIYLQCSLSVFSFSWCSSVFFRKINLKKSNFTRIFTEKEFWTAIVFYRAKFYPISPWCFFLYLFLGNFSITYLMIFFLFDLATLYFLEILGNFTHP